MMMSLMLRVSLLRILYSVNRMNDDFGSIAPVDSFVTKVKAFPAYVPAGVDLLNRALAYLVENDPTKSLVKAKKLRAISMGHEPWTDEEKKDLLREIAQHGNNLETIAENFKTKNLKDIVKRYYIILGCEQYLFPSFSP